MNSYSKTALAAAICSALTAGHAGAATFNVSNNNDAGAGSLRAALSQADANAGPDTVDLSSISGQTITLTSGQLVTNDDDTVDELTIEGSGVTINADGNSRVLLSYFTDLVINDLTITGGDSSSAPARGGMGPSTAGGGIYSLYGSLELNDSTVTGNSTPSFGGGVAHMDSDGALEIARSTISGNSAGSGGGIASYVLDDDTTIRNSIISNNTATGGNGGGLRMSGERAQAIREEFGRGLGGGSYAGGMYSVSFYGNLSIEDSTISGNTADSDAGIYGVAVYGSASIERSTISGNQAMNGASGGGVLLGKYATVTNSTISGNSASEDIGGFAMVSYSNVNGQGQPPAGPSGIRVDFSTITGNTSGSQGGGLSLFSSDTTINASVIAGNSAPIDPDVALGGGVVRGGGGGGTADVTFSLIGVDPSTGTLNKDATSTSLTGANPQLGPLAANGGPTQTHLPASGSPLIDAVGAGQGGCGTSVTGDQRGSPRPFGPGCDIGAVERGDVVAPLAVPFLDRLGLLLMAGLLGVVGLFGFRRRSSPNA